MTPFECPLEIVDNAGRHWIKNDPDSTRVTVRLGAEEVEALRAFHATKAAEAKVRGLQAEADRHRREGDAMAAAMIRLRLEPGEPQHPTAVFLDAEGRDTGGNRWIPAPSVPGVRMIPITSGPCVALWRAYQWEGDRALSRGDKAGAAQCHRIAADFLTVARELDPALGEFADNPPHYGPGGWS